jgi:hypothetical protein
MAGGVSYEKKRKNVLVLYLVFYSSIFTPLLPSRLNYYYTIKNKRKCPSLIPGLRSTPFWDTSQEDMAWTRILEEKYEVIREELLSLNGQRKFQVCMHTERITPSSTLFLPLFVKFLSFLFLKTNLAWFLAVKIDCIDSHIFTSLYYTLKTKTCVALSSSLILAS